MQPYNEEDTRERFLQEVARLKAAGRFLTDGEFCKEVKQTRGFLNEIKHPKPGRNYRIPNKTLYYAYHVYQLDIMFVILGIRNSPEPEHIPEWKHLNAQGRLGDKTWKPGQNRKWAKKEE